MGRRPVNRGDIRWCTFRLPDKRRPALILSRDEIVNRLDEVIVVPATRTIRGLKTEVVLTPEEGLPEACVLNFDHVGLLPRARVGEAICVLSERKWDEVRRALLSACGFPPDL